MKKSYRILLITLVAMICLIFSSTTVFAVNANPDPFPFIQPNGSAISVWQFGDEFLHWSEDANGNLIVFDDAKDGFCYATWSDNGEVSTGELVGAGLPLAMARNAGSKHTIPAKVIAKAEETRATLTEGLFDEQAFIQAMTTAMAAPAGTAPQYAEVDKMKRKMLMIHVTFADRSNILTREGEVMPKMSGQQIYDLCFGLREEVDRSVNGYYQDLLMTDEIIITPAEVLKPMDGCQGVIEVVLPYMHPNYASDDPKSAAAMREAMALACEQNLINLVPFDTNGDGTLATAELAIGMIFDGFEYSMGRIVPNFWGVSIGSGSTPAANLTQGVKIASLFAQGAFHRNSGDVYDDAGTPGVIVHEMGHSGYSFQDTYDTGSLSAGSGGLGYWSMQASGDNGRLPGEYAGATSGYQCAYNLVRSGFVIPGVLAYGETAVMDNHLDIYLMQTPIVTPVESTPVTNYFGAQYRGQYFLLQQRKFGDTFNYDQGAFGYISSNTGVPVDASIGGMLIQHVDLNVPTNRISNKPGHYRAGYEEAHGGVQTMQQRSGARGRAGEFSDLWGVEQFEFSYRSDPGSGVYAYDDGRAWVNALTPIPNQDTPSGVAISEIHWDPVTLTTSFMSGLKPEFDVQPQGGRVLPGKAYELNVTAVSLDDGDLTYQWYCDGLPIDGATAASYTVISDALGLYDYYVEVTNTVTDTLDGEKRSTVAVSDTATVEVTYDFKIYMESPVSEVLAGDSFYVDVMLVGDFNYTRAEAEIVFDTDLLIYDGYSELAGLIGDVTKTGDTIKLQSVPNMNLYTGAPCIEPVKLVRLKFISKDDFIGNIIDTDLSFKSVTVNPQLGVTGMLVAAGDDLTITLYKMVAFTLDASGGIVLPFSLPTQASKIMEIHPATQVIDLPQAHKHGYLFEGWTLDGLPLTEADITDGAINGKTVYADFKLEYDEPLTLDEEDFLALLDYDHVDYLAHYISEEIGNRITFSPRRDMCVDWIVDELESYGYDPVVSEFTATGSPTIDGLIWIGGKHYTYYGPTYAASSVYQYNSDTELEITGATVVNWANSGSALTLPAGDYAGKAVFLVTNGSFPSAANAYNAALALQDAGAAAVMIQTLPMAASGNTTYSRLGNTTTGTALTIPVGSVLNYETTDILASLDATSKVTLTLRSRQQVKNVIATLPSATGSDKSIYITSHHDTTSSGPGLNDNGSGTIMSLEMARAFKHWSFEYNIVFVFFDSEESGSMRGSTNFCSNMTAEEKANFVANYNMDMIATSQANCQWMFMNISDSRLNTMQNAIPSGANPTVALADNPAAVAVAKEYGIYTTTMKAAAKMGFTDSILFCYDTTTDHYRFVLNGMPNAVEYDWRSNRRGSGFETLYHRAGDTYALNFSIQRCQTQADIISLAIYDAAKGFRPIPVIESGITVNFPGIKDATVKYYTNVSGWQTVGVFDNTCNFEIPAEHKATLGATTVQVLKGGMWYDFSGLEVGDNHIVLTIPLDTITAIGIVAECDLGVAQEDWVYSSAAALVGEPNVFLVFDNNKPYEVRLNKTGFHTIAAPDIYAGDTVDFSACFYEVTVPAGITDVRMQSNGWIYPLPANAGDKILLLRDIFDAAREAHMTFIYAGETHTVDFLLDGTDPFGNFDAGTGVIAIPMASVEHLTGNQNKLTITVTEILADGTKKEYSDNFTIDNNAAGTYTVGPYSVYVDTKGNDQIRECYIVK